MNSSGYRSGQERIVLVIVLWVVVIAVGAGLVWLGYALGNRGADDTASDPSQNIESALLSPTPFIGVMAPTVTPLPVATFTPTPIAATPTPEQAMMSAGANGLNVRSGPGTNFSILVHVDPGTTFPIIGYYADWWQIDYNGTPAWANKGVVDATNTASVAQVVPPPSPIPPPPTATPQPTSTPAPTAVPFTPTPDTRGLVVNSFNVERAPGPYGNSGDIWFNIDITNKSGQSMTITKLGVYVFETGDFQMSWGGPAGGEPLVLGNGHRFEWRDHINQFALPAGSFNLWLRVCWTDGCMNIDGPIGVTIG